MNLDKQNQMQKQVSAEAYARNRHQLWDQMQKQVWTQVRDQVLLQVLVQVMDQLQEAKNEPR